jgi:hypothetical protein
MQYNDPLKKKSDLFFNNHFNFLKKKLPSKLA